MARPSTAVAPAAADEYDVVIIGAGISGINSAYRVQERFPHFTYTILEGREAMGGTWDLFRYPGIRSDSDLHTFGFQWNHWDEAEDIARGENIRRYIKRSAAKAGIDRHIRFGHRVTATEWTTAAARWRVAATTAAGPRAFRARFLLFCTGYYDYEEPLSAAIPGLERFAGTVVHPQFWPEQLDWTGKQVAIIGSGATAITILPVVAAAAARVTMIQRSPGYIVSLPAVSPSSQLLVRWLPAWLSWRLVRAKNLVVSYLFFRFCRRFPARARAALRQRTRALLPASFALDPHFQPAYNPWEQRLCVCPDEDFYASLRAGKADIVTGTIDHVDAASVHVNGPRASAGPAAPPRATVPADILVTATGLKMKLAGGATISVDGQPVDLHSKFLWRGVMIQDVPNATLTMGYTNASWTLGADAAALQTVRIIAHTESQGCHAVCPRLDPAHDLTETSLMNLSSTYVQRAQSILPKAGTTAPWAPRVSYFSDLWQARFGDIRKGLNFF